MKSGLEIVCLLNPLRTRGPLRVEAIVCKKYHEMILSVVVSSNLRFRATFSREFLSNQKDSTNMSRIRSDSLAGYVESLQARGVYTFTKDQAAESISGTPSAIKLALNRLAAKKRIVRIRRDFYTIVPIEYAAKGILPPDWFIDQLMEFLGKPYYVGLLSAAAAYGSSIQQPQEYQVIVPDFMRPINTRNLRIRFFKRSRMAGSPTRKVKSATGYIKVSDPAVTAIDLVGYARQIGGYEIVIPPINELCKMLNPDMLIDAAKREPNLAFIQRLGHILDWLGEHNLSGRLASWLSTKEPAWIALDPSNKKSGSDRDSKWHVIVNTQLHNEP